MIPKPLALGAAALLAGAVVSTPAAAGADAGRAKAGACAVCHGPQGLATAPEAPNLAGQPEIYLVAQLRNFRNGKRAHEVMGVIAKGLSDDDIDDLAAWYGSLKVEIKEGRQGS